LARSAHMSTHFSTAASPMPLSSIDWPKLARDAFGQGFVAGFIGGSLQALAQMLDAKKRDDERENAIDGGDDDAEAAEAAAFLGVAPTASEDEIRAALRARLASSRLHPDHGGDGVEASRLIAAKNLLVERTKRAQAGTP